MVRLNLFRFAIEAKTRRRPVWLRFKNKHMAVRRTCGTSDGLSLAEATPGGV